MEADSKATYQKILNAVGIQQFLARSPKKIVSGFRQLPLSGPRIPASHDGNDREFNRQTPALAI